MLRKGLPFRAVHKLPSHPHMQERAEAALFASAKQSLAARGQLPPAGGGRPKGAAFSDLKRLMASALAGGGGGGGKAGDAGEFFASVPRVSA